MGASAPSGLGGTASRRRLRSFSWAAVSPSPETDGGLARVRRPRSTVATAPSGRPPAAHCSRLRAQEPGVRLLPVPQSQSRALGTWRRRRPITGASGVVAHARPNSSHHSLISPHQRPQATHVTLHILQQPCQRCRLPAPPIASAQCSPWNSTRQARRAAAAPATIICHSHISHSTPHGSEPGCCIRPQRGRQKSNGIRVLRPLLCAEYVRWKLEAQYTAHACRP